MNSTLASPIFGLVVNKQYSWDTMEQNGWTYIGSRKENVELFEVWECDKWKALVNNDGKIISITQKHASQLQD